jgi:hypothetical protein
MRRYIAILLIILPSVCLADPVPPSIDFHIDGVIEDGNVFSDVRTFDNATVDMTGGEIHGFLQILNTSTFNAYGGSMEMADVSVTAALNLYYLQITPNRIWTQGSSAMINVYGKNFEYVPSSGDWLLNGNWANNEEFSLRLRGPDTRNYVFTHEIPEPGTLVMLFFGILGLKKKYH